MLDIGIFPHHRAHLFPQACRFIENYRALALQVGKKHFGLPGAVRLCQRHDGGTVDVFQRTFGIDIKFPQGIHFITEKFNAHRIFPIDGIDVHNAATGAELADTLDFICMLIAQLYQPLPKFFQSDFLAHADTDAQAIKILPADALLYSSCCLSQYNDRLLAH